jgi:hypothetical protein
MSGETPSGNIRLVNGSNDQEGFIQIRTTSQNNYKWGMICNTNQIITTLVCQELGFQSGRFVQYKRIYCKLRRSWLVFRGFYLVTGHTFAKS